jgi:hypothetical protein
MLIRETAQWVLPALQSAPPFPPLPCLAAGFLRLPLRSPLITLIKRAITAQMTATQRPVTPDSGIERFVRASRRLRARAAWQSTPDWLTAGE